MRFGPDVLLEIMDIVRQGLTEGKDVSQMLRDIDVTLDVSIQRVVLSEQYKERGKD
jgi:hypothetical protein